LTIPENIKEKLTGYLRDIHRELVGYEFLIDRRFASDLIVKVLDKNCDFKIQKMLLETFAKVFELSNEDRIKIGLTALTSPQTKNVQKHFKLIDLVKELNTYLNNIS
jgi:hypothetical protein